MCWARRPHEPYYPARLHGLHRLRQGLPGGSHHRGAKDLHVIEPAICIDCGACGRICPADAVVDNHHKSVTMLKRSLWLKPLVIEKKCISCGICLEVCPTSVLDFAELKPDQVRAVAYLKDAKNCIGCSFCEVACPVDAIEMKTPTEK